MLFNQQYAKRARVVSDIAAIDTHRVDWMDEFIELFVELAENESPQAAGAMFRALDGTGCGGGWIDPDTGEFVEWHWKLRRVRNHPVKGKALFAIFGGAL